MAEFHKTSSKEPFLSNCAAAAARINRFAVDSVDIIVKTVRKTDFYRIFYVKPLASRVKIWYTFNETFFSSGKRERSEESEGFF